MPAETQTQTGQQDGQQQGSQTAQTTTTQESSQQQTSQQATATGPTSGTPSQQQPQGFTYKEDRSQWNPPHRLREETTKRQTIEQENKTLRAQLQALTGATPPDQSTQKAKEVQDAFFQFFPQFKKFASLTEEQIDRLLSTPDRMSAVDEIESREWSRHGKAQMTALHEGVAEAIGAESLTADQKTDLTDAFKAWFSRTVESEIVESKRTTGEESSETFRRYQEGDQKLIADFVKRYTSNWLEPARRRVTQQTVNNRTRPVPQSGGRSQVTQNSRPAEFKTLDERLDFMAKTAREAGAFAGQ